MGKQIPLVRALTWIVASTLLVSGSGFAALKAYLKWQKKRCTDPSYNISFIVQTGPQREALKTDYLAELMNLSCDKPQNAARFDCVKARENLLRSPVVKEAEVSVEFPNTLHVDYTVRQPIARVFDYTNYAIDEDGVLFPLTPFFSPKNLPELYLGKGTPDLKHIKLAFAILNYFAAHDQINVERIDVSQASAETLGKREIVVVVREGETPHYLRLSTHHIEAQVQHYLAVRETVVADARSCTVDLRVPELAYLKKKG